MRERWQIDMLSNPAHPWKSSHEHDSCGLKGKNNGEVNTDLGWQDCFFSWWEADWAQKHFRFLVYLIAWLFVWWILVPLIFFWRNPFLNKMSEIITLVEIELKFENHLTVTIIYMGLTLLFPCLQFWFNCWCNFKVHYFQV